MSFTKQEQIITAVDELDARKEEITDGEYLKQMNILQDAWKSLSSSEDEEDDDDEEVDEEVQIEPFPSVHFFVEETPIGKFEFYKENENCYYILYYRDEEEIPQYYYKDWDEQSFKQYISIGRIMPRRFLDSIRTTFTSMN